MLDIIIGCITFWTTFVTCGLSLPQEKAVTRPKLQVSKNKLWATLACNLVASFAILPAVYCIPMLYVFADTWHQKLLKYIVSALLADMWFYHMHRLFHTKLFYKWHATHHAYVQPHALAALYCSAAEMVLINQLSVAITFRIFNYSLAELVFFNILLALNALKGHSGLQLYEGWIYEKLARLGFTSELHDLHHKKMVCNYGVTYIIDYLYGTLRLE